MPMANFRLAVGLAEQSRKRVSEVEHFFLIFNVLSVSNVLTR